MSNIGLNNVFILGLILSFLLSGCDKFEYTEPVGAPSEMKSVRDKGDVSSIERSGDEDGDDGDDEGGLQDGDITDDNDDEDDTITDDNDDEDDDESTEEGISREIPNGPAGAAFPGDETDGSLRFRY